MSNETFGPWAVHLLLAAATLPFAAHAQQEVHVDARLDTNEIRIGEQARLQLSVTYRADQGPTHITWPTITDTLTAKVPVLHDSRVDTILPEKETDPYLFSQVRTLTITSWDSGYWAIPPFHFVVNDDTLDTAPLLITVHTVPVDTEADFRDIKDIYAVPFSLWSWLKQYWPWLVGALALAGLVALIITKLRKRTPKPVATAPPPPKAPPHIRALEALEALQQKKLWEQGNAKAYHTELTDILRSYLQERYGVAAMECTTEELLAGLHLSAMPRARQQELAPLLRLADMVKFAKWAPLPQENQQAMTSAVELVRNTAPAPDEGRSA